MPTPSKLSIQLPPLLLDRLQKEPSLSSRRGHVFAMASAKTVTQQRLENANVLTSSRPNLHDDWRQMIAARSLRQRLQKKIQGAKSDEEGSDSSDAERTERGQMDFARVGQKIAEHMRKQGVIFRSQLDITYSIEALERIWLKFDDGIEEDDFVSLLSSVLSTDPRKLSTLFQKMDANADGSIEWDEFLSYLLKEATHNWERACEEGRAYLKHGTQSHELLPTMRSVIHVPASNNRGSKYAALCDDRAVRVFDCQTLSMECLVPLKAARCVVLNQIEPVVDLHNAEVAARERINRHRDQFQTRTRLRHYRDRLVASARTATPYDEFLLPTTSFQPHSAKHFAGREPVPTPTAITYDTRKANIIVASSDKSITMYGASFDRRHKLQFHLEDGLYVRTSPSCLDVGDIGDESCLLLGDSHGGISILAGSAENRQIRHNQAHGMECVRKIMLVPNIGVASGGMDADIVMTDIDRWESIRRMKGHARGIYGLSQCQQNRLLVSLAYDAKILLWDPYIATSTGSVHGHHSDVVDIVLNEKHNQMMTATLDRKIYVYDIRMWRCIQTLIMATNHRTQTDACISAMTFDPMNEQFVTGGTALQTWQVVSDQGESVKNSTLHPRAHRSLVVAVLHSPVFKQVISVSVDERVCLWDVFSGTRSFDFIANHNAPITAACLDHRGKRLLTAAQNGTVKMWNFNNGAMMHEYNKRKREISAILYLPKALFSTVGVSVNEGIIRWADPGAPSNTTPVFVHSDDEKEPQCIVHIADLFASGDRNGELVIRYATSAIVKKRLQLPATGDKTDAINKIKCLTISNVTFGFIGTDSGALHTIESRTWNVISTQFKAMSESIVALDGDNVACRLLACDSTGTAKIWDLQALTVENISTHMLLIREFVIVDRAESVTATIFCPDIQAFVVGTDSGDIRLWTLEGLPIARFGQLEPWPMRPLDGEQADVKTEFSISQTNQECFNNQSSACAKELKTNLAFRLSNPKTLQPKGLRSESFFTVEESVLANAKQLSTTSKAPASMLEAALFEMKAYFCNDTKVHSIPNPNLSASTPRFKKSPSKRSLEFGSR